MTVAELIEALKQYPESRPVLIDKCVDGFCGGGFCTPDDLIVYSVKTVPKNQGHAFELCDDEDELAVWAVALATHIRK